MVRVNVPHHLRTRARVEGEVQLTVERPVTQRTIRGHVRNQRRSLVRFLTCEQDVSNEPSDALLPDSVAIGGERVLIVGTIAGD